MHPNSAVGTLGAMEIPQVLRQHRSGLFKRCGGIVVSNVAATIIVVRLRSSYTLRLLTGAGFI